jgi:hypothetical protein
MTPPLSEVTEQLSHSLGRPHTRAPDADGLDAAQREQSLTQPEREANQSLHDG